MSTQSVINAKNVPTWSTLEKFFMGCSMDILKKIRFEYGIPNVNKGLEMLFWDKCVNPESQKLKREQVIKNSIYYIPEL